MNLSNSLDNAYYRPCVGAMLFNNKGQVWLGKRIADPNKSHSYAWQMPQGGIDLGEDPADAVMRELMEETGLEIQLNSEIYETIFDYKAGYLTLVFVGTAEDRPLRLNPEIRSGGFFAPEAVPPEMYAPQLEILHRWLEPDMAARLPKPSDQTSDDLCRT